MEENNYENNQQPETIVLFQIFFFYCFVEQCSLITNE